MSKKTKRERQERQLKFKLGIAAGISLVVIGSIVLIILFLRQNSDTTPEPNTIDEAAIDAAVSAADKSGKLRDQAQSEIEKNDFSKAEDLYKTAVESESEVNKRVKLYIDLANAYYGAGKLDEAIAAALRAESASSDKFLAADWLARAYKVKGEYDKSLKYYELAMNSVNSTQNEYKFDKAYYEEDIATVKRLQLEAKNAN